MVSVVRKGRNVCYTKPEIQEKTELHLFVKGFPIFSWVDSLVFRYLVAEPKIGLLISHWASCEYVLPGWSQCI